MKTNSDLHARNSGYAILAALVFSASAESLFAQGYISMSTATANKPRITLDGRNVQPEDNVFVQVLVAGASSLTGIHTFAMTLTGANAGLFSKGLVTVNGIPGGSAVDVTIRAWDKDTGANYDSSTVRDSATLLGFVLGGLIDSNGSGGSLPPSIVPAFKGLTLVTPEPGTYALAALGLALLCVKKF